MAYKIEEAEIENIKAIQLRKGDQVVMEVLPEEGAMLHQLYFEVAGNWIKAVEGYDDYGQVPGNPHARGAILFPFPNRLENGTYRYEGREYQFPVDGHENGNAIHGFVKHESFKVLEKEAHEEGGHLKLAYYYSGDRNYYPFAFGLIVTFTYTSDRLDVGFDLENRGNGHMPVGFGWHPYLTLNKRPIDQLKLKLPFVSQVVLNEEKLPTGQVQDFMDHEEPNDIGEANFDDCYKLIMQDHSLLYDTERELGLALEASQECLFLQVYTPETRESIAIEPMNCNINAFNNQEGLMDLERGSFYHISCAIRVVEKDEYEELFEE